MFYRIMIITYFDTKTTHIYIYILIYFYFYFVSVSYVVQISSYIEVVYHVLSRLRQSATSITRVSTLVLAYDSDDDEALWNLHVGLGEGVRSILSFNSSNMEVLNHVLSDTSFIKNIILIIMNNIKGDNTIPGFFSNPFHI